MLSLLKGRVLDTEDPSNSGRIRVFIPGTFDFQDTNQYPWIIYLSPFPSGEDTGAFMVPEIGDYVLALGNTDSFGSTEYYCIGGWNTENDKPKEATNTTNKILYKSVTGHTIELDDTLEQEKFRIIDRSGQTLEFTCALKKEAGKRGLGNVIDGGAKSVEGLVDKATITLKDLCGNELGMQSATDDNKLWIKQKDGNQIQLTQNTIEITAGDTHITLNTSDGSLNIHSTGEVKVSGSKIILNNGTGGIHSSQTFPNDYFTGIPLTGSPTEFSN